MTGQPLRVGLVRLDDVVFHPHNVRRDLGDLRPLTHSIRRFGVMQPVVVENHDGWLRLRAGHRRTAAARLAGLTRIPAVIHDQALDDQEWLIQSVHENAQRRDLDLLERARAVTALREMGCTWDGIAEAFGVWAGTCAAWVRGAGCVDVRGGLPPGVERRRQEVDGRVDRIAEASSEGLSAAVTASRVGVTPRTVVRHRNRGYTITSSTLRTFVEAWRAVPDTTTSDVLDALAGVADTGRVTGHLPGQQGDDEAVSA